MSDKTKVELETENEELRKLLAAQAGANCPNCGFNAAEHEALVNPSGDTAEQAT